RDDTRIGAAIARLRAKWSTLEQRLRQAPEFRIEKALWLLDERQLQASRGELASILAEAPDWPDALAVAALLSLASGDSDGAKKWFGCLGDRRPVVDGVAVRLRAYLRQPA